MIEKIFEFVRVILSGGQSPKSNPEGVCEAQDLQRRIPLVDPASPIGSRFFHRVILSLPKSECNEDRMMRSIIRDLGGKSSTPLRSAQDDTRACNIFT